MSKDRDQRVKEAVLEHYSEVARTNGSCGCGPACCGSAPGSSPELGYSAAEIASLPSGADMGLGCGTPLAFAALRAGETVLDLGSGGGIDCFLAGHQVGPGGTVIGVDMTPAMVAKARENAVKANASNVEFRLGEIEALPLGDRAVDVVVSNCVVNLSADKPAVFREVFRVLRPGGRLAISDIVASQPLPSNIADNPAALAGCVAGAPAVAELIDALTGAGFEEVSIEINEASRSFIKNWIPDSGAEHYVASAAIRAVRPAGAGCCGTTSQTTCC